MPAGPDSYRLILSRDQADVNEHEGDLGAIAFASRGKRYQVHSVSGLVLTGRALRHCLKRPRIWCPLAQHGASADQVTWAMAEVLDTWVMILWELAREASLGWVPHASRG